MIIIILLLLILIIITITTYLSHLLSSSPSLDLVHAQYVFIHDVLAEALIVGNTSVVKHNLPCYVRSLESSDSSSEGFPSWKLLEKQFTLATELHPPSHQYLTAVNPVNQVDILQHQLLDPNFRLFIPLYSTLYYRCTTTAWTTWQWT